MLDFHSKEIKLNIWSRFMELIYNSLKELSISLLTYEIESEVRNVNDLSWVVLTI